MADVTVSELAEKVGTSVERLLKQIKEAGLSEKSATSLVNDEEKRTLLSFLKSNHGDSEAAPKKMTLQRKTKSTIKGPGRKQVNVETRKKRTYVKRDAEETAGATDSAADVAAAESVVAETGAKADAPNPSEKAPVATSEPAAAPEPAEAPAEAKSAETVTAEAPEAKPEAQIEPEPANAEASTEETVEAKETPKVENVSESKTEKPAEPTAAEKTQSVASEAPAKSASAKKSAPAADKKAASAKKEAPRKAEPANKAKGAESGKKAEEAPAKQTPPPAPTPKKFSFMDDAEERRIAAMKARKEEEARQAEELKRKKAELEEKKRVEAEEKAAASKKKQPAATKPTATKPTEEKGAATPQFRRPAPAAAGDDEDSLKAKKPGKSRVKGAGPKKANMKSLLNLVDDDFDEDAGRRQRRRAASSKNNQHGFKKPTGKIVHEVELGENIVVSDLAQKMSVKAGELIKRLMKMGVMATVNQPLDRDTAQLIIEEMGHTVKFVSDNQLEDDVAMAASEEGETVNRAAVVTVMGHVDHGKTSLLDYIRKAKVASGEAGGITQHIGAYRVKTNQGDITFLDTPGHAAFTAMRARGAQCTDVVILVVAADDGMMPQTREAVEHARAAGVPIVVAVNKIDKDTADPDRVRNDLSTVEVIPEEWGGDTQFVNVSAHTGEGIDELLEAVALQAELLELSAQTKVPARGVVVESRMEKGRGVVATVLVQHGELERGNILLAGQSFGRVRAMTDEFGKQSKQAGPSTPVEILGLDTAPNAGDDFLVVADERKAREVAEGRAEREREERQRRQQAAKLENMFANFGGSGEEQKILPVVLKADVRGSLEAISAALLDIGNEEVQVNIVSSGIGGITDNDINLAVTSGAIVLGFNVRAAASTRTLAEEESVEIRYYSVIYQLLDEVKSALGGMLAPERVEEIVGIADVREVFRSPKFGQVAGCMVTEGTVYRSKPIRVLRDNVVIFEGELESLRRFKDDVNEVRNGTECGIGVKDYDVKVGDQIEVYDVKEVAREL